MDYTMEALFPIVAELAQKYSGYDSTSIPYEKAQMLMGGIIYCLNEYKNSSENGLAVSNQPIKERYRIGAKIVLKKVVESKDIYNEISLWFDDYNVACLSDTMRKEIPYFFKWYDVNFCPQNTVLTFDYPLLVDIHSLTGVDYIHTYLRAMKVEWLFLRKFERNYVIEILKRANPEYSKMVENVSEIVLINLLGHIVVGKPFSEIGFHIEEYEKLRSLLRQNSVNEIENILHTILKQLIEQVYEGNQAMLSYFENAIKSMAVRIKNAVETQQLDRIFVKHPIHPAVSPRE